MKADELDIWDTEELARLLAEKYLDADDLIEVVPEAATIGTFEESLLDEFIDRNWEEILSTYDKDSLGEWLSRLDENEEFILEMDNNRNLLDSFYEFKDMEYFVELVKQSKLFHYPDLAERWGHPKKATKS